MTTEDHSKKPRAKPRSALEKVVDQAVTGDLVILYSQNGTKMGTAQSIERVTDVLSAEDIVARWKAWGVMHDGNTVEVWEVGRNFYRKR